MPVTNFSIPEKYKYLEGFGSYHQSEAVPGGNPVGINSPQIPPFGLRTERISGTSFTAPRASNQQTWLYRITSSLSHDSFSALASQSSVEITHTPNALRWNHFPSNPNTDFPTSLHSLGTTGSPTAKTGVTYHLYSASASMPPRTAFSSNDGDFLIIPHSGTLDIRTELGSLLVRNGEIAVIPRGIRYHVSLPNGPARGYICELHQGHFQLPSLGPLGSSMLANVRDFQIPTAAFDGRMENGLAVSSSDSGPWTITTRFASRLWSCTQRSSPFDVVAWHGTYYPYKYDLGRFSVVGSILFDHPDPSIFTVLTAPSHREPGTAVVEFGVIMPRWMAMEGTYWEPYFHRNTMAEFAGVVRLEQDAGGEKAKKKGGMLDWWPFAALLNNSMVPHGMDEARHMAARERDTTKPVKIGADDGWAVFLLESEAMVGVSKWALDAAVGGGGPRL